MSRFNFHVTWKDNLYHYHFFQGIKELKETKKKMPKEMEVWCSPYEQPIKKFYKEYNNQKKKEGKLNWSWSW